MFSDQLEDVLKKAGVPSEKNKRACIKRFISTNEARKVNQDHAKLRSVYLVYYSNGKRKA